MYRVLPILAAIAALAASGAGLAAIQSSSTPTLQLVDRSPLTVKGVHFKLRERVRVTAATDTDTATQIARTTRKGVFSVEFGTFGENTCATITIKAVGARGDRATLQVTPPPPVDGPTACRPV